MELPQIDAAACAVLVTLRLWVWTRLKLPEGCHYQEAALKRQNTCAYVAFSAFIVLEVLTEVFTGAWLRWMAGPASGVVFYVFAVTSYQNDIGFWSKKRNQMLGLALVFAGSGAASLFFTELSFIPMFGSLAVSHLCHKKYVQTVFSSMKDLETLQAKLLKEEAHQANMRHFDRLSVRQSSQQA